MDDLYPHDSLPHMTELRIKPYSVKYNIYKHIILCMHACTHTSENKQTLIISSYVELAMYN